MSNLRRSAFTVAFVLSASACAKGEAAPSFFNDEATKPASGEVAKQPFGSGTSGPTTASVAPAIRSFIEAYCTKLEPACWQRGEGAEPSTDSAMCQRSLLQQAYASELTFDAAKATECLAADFWNVSFACGGVLKRVSAKAAGEPCTSDSECANAGTASGLCAQSSDGKRCANVTRGNEGDACLGTSGAPLSITTSFAGSICVRNDGLSCDPSGVCIADPHVADGCEQLGPGETPAMTCDGRCVASKCTDASLNADVVACFGFTSMHSFDF